MKIVKNIHMLLLTVIVYCITVNIAFASEYSLAIITFNNTGKEVATDELLYYPQQQMWKFIPEGSTQEQLVRAKDACK